MGSTLFIFSCQKENSYSDNQEFIVENRDVSCLTASLIEELGEGCCRYLVCVDPLLSGQFYLTAGAGGPKIFLDESNCAEITICGTTEISLYDYTVGKPTLGCSLTLTCHDREACCESICFDFNPINTIGLCTEFLFTLDGDEACFPNGVPIYFQDGPIEFVSASSPQGEVEFLGVWTTPFGITNYWYFEFCLDDLYQENIIEITFREFYCDTEITMSFDLLKPDQPNHRKCD